jgi:hypothetical protein
LGAEHGGGCDAAAAALLVGWSGRHGFLTEHNCGIAMAQSKEPERLGGTPTEASPRFVFPKWVNQTRNMVLVVVLFGPLYAGVLLVYGASPECTDVGYQPEQPIPYSHALHAQELGMDCRYCHNTVEETAHAAIPPTQTCMNCHAKVRASSEKLTILRDSYYRTGMPVEWVRVHDLPDYVYFNHSAHVSRGIGCVSCHGRVDQMEVVHQVHTLSMGWCLDCHREPEKHLRPLDKITDMEWVPADQLELGQQLREDYNINPSTDCSTCHR